ncbi:hypothetical protein ACTQ46_07360 [Gallicola sp. Sow4_E12]|uniref:hypothetical protein n=1 Tax=Gallicola sp. Sow4_E12 TaxID=3438785 RepID=UPI003F900CBD
MYKRKKLRLRIIMSLYIIILAILQINGFIGNVFYFVLLIAGLLVFWFLMDKI